MDNMFKVLGKYKLKEEGDELSKDERDERENYFTESFKVILLHNKPILENFIKLLLSNRKINQISLGEFIDVDTQKKEFFNKNNKKWVIVDLRLIFSKGKILCEHKIESKEGIDTSNLKQVEKLLKTGEYVAYISNYYESLSEEYSENEYFLGRFDWYEIYKIIEKYTNTSDEGKNLLVLEFLSFMEDEYDMKPWNPTKVDNTIITAHESLDFIKNKIFEALKEENKKLKFFNFRLDDNKLPSYDHENDSIYLIFYFKKDLLDISSEDATDENINFDVGFNKEGFFTRLFIPIKYIKILEKSNEFKGLLEKYKLSKYLSKDNSGIFSSYEYSKWISESSPEKLIIQNMLKSIRNYRDVIEVIKGILKK